jgi:hypothetical protein
MCTAVARFVGFDPLDHDGELDGVLWRPSGGVEEAQGYALQAAVLVLVAACAAAIDQFQRSRYQAPSSPRFIWAMTM